MRKSTMLQNYLYKSKYNNINFVLNIQICLFIVNFFLPISECIINKLNCEISSNYDGKKSRVGLRPNPRASLSREYIPESQQVLP